MKRDLKLLPRLHLWHAIISRLLDRSAPNSKFDINTKLDLIYVQYDIEDTIHDILSADSNET